MPPGAPPPSTPDDLDDLDAGLTEAEHGIGADAHHCQQFFSARVRAAVARLHFPSLERAEDAGAAAPAG